MLQAEQEEHAGEKADEKADAAANAQGRGWGEVTAARALLVGVT